MVEVARTVAHQVLVVVFATGKRPLFRIGETVRIGASPAVGRDTLPAYLDGKTGIVEAIVTTAAVDDEEEQFGSERPCHRLNIPMAEMWERCSFALYDSLHIAVFKTLLEKIF